MVSRVVSRRVALVASMALTVGAGLLAVGTPASGAPQTQDFAFTGASQPFAVPAGVLSITVDAYGAEGGEGDDGAPSGLGGRATAVVCVTPGEILQVNVGGVGVTPELDGVALDTEPADAPASTDVSAQALGAAGGFNGGGDALLGGGNTGGGGGGASDVRRGAFGLAERLVAAGGGGGGGGDSAADDGDSAGGGGGGATGGDGQPSDSDPPTPGGGGGTQTAGGVAATAFDPTVTAGAFGQGGTGGEGTNENDGGGGGGGGWWGGGGGAGDDDDSDDGGGGGGGSGFGPAGVAFETGVRTGDGLVTLSWDPDVVAAGCAVVVRFTG